MGDKHEGGRRMATDCVRSTVGGVCVYSLPARNQCHRIHVDGASSHRGYAHPIKLVMSMYDQSLATL